MRLISDVNITLLHVWTILSMADNSGQENVELWKTVQRSSSHKHKY